MLAGVFLFFCGRAVSANYPNVLIILADDLGYHDLSCQGSDDFKTPGIDQLASSGIRFIDGYVSAPQCGPSRAGLMTGVSQSRFGYLDNYMHHGLPSKDLVQTLPEQMRAQGYVTGIIGKWHIGDLDSSGKIVPGNKPWERGFDYALTMNRGLSHYFPYSPEGREWMSFRRREFRLEQKLETEIKSSSLDGLPPETYLTDYFSMQAGDFIRRHADQPWFLYLSYNAPHTPMNAKEELLRKYQNIPDETRRTLAAMMDSLDQGVGSVMRVLEETDQTRRTLVWFLSDNGGPTHHNASRNDPFSGKKGDVHEGGIRVPFMVSWPGVIASNQVVDVPITSLDILPTSLSAAGLQIIPDVYDGRNLMPWLANGASAPETQLFWSWRNKSAVRVGSFKETRNENTVLSAAGAEIPGHVFSDLKENPQELAGKALKSPERKQMLSRALDCWLTQVVADQEALVPVSDAMVFGPTISLVQQEGSTLFEDDFSRDDTFYSADARAIGTRWRNSIPFAAKWGIRNGSVGVLTAGHNTVLYTKSLNTISGGGCEFSVEADIAAQFDNAWSGVAFHVQDSDNYYMLRFKSGFSNWHLFKVINRETCKIKSGEIFGVFLKDRTYAVHVSSSEPFKFNLRITDEDSGKVLAEDSAEDATHSFSGGYAGLYQGSSGALVPKVIFKRFALTISSGI